MSVEEYNSVNGTWNFVDAAEILEKSGRQILDITIRDIRTDINACLKTTKVKEVSKGRIYNEIGYVFYKGEWPSGWFGFNLMNFRAWMVDTNQKNFNLSGSPINSH